MNKQTVLQWHGEDVAVRYGFCDVETNTEKPLYWYNYHCRETGKARLHAVEITPKEGNPFVIYNGHGIGWFKLSKGGWPNEGHASLDIETFTEDKEWTIDSYDQVNFRMEIAREREWFAAKYPDEEKKREALLAIINRKK